MENVSVIGIGKLGLCFALTLEKAGYNVLGLDLNPEYVNIINNKDLISEEQGVSKALLNSTNFRATTDLKETVEHSDVLYVVVATPSLENGRYDHSQVDGLVDNLLSLGKQQSNKHFVVCCTTMPGYCDTVSDRVKDYGYTVSYNPEFIAQGTILRDQAKPDMVLIGEGSTVAGDIIQKMYEEMTLNEPRVCRMSAREAEITKISLNCFLTTKIAYANMVGDIVLASGGDPSKVLSAIGSDSRIGNKYLGYGYGYGGPCFPRDNRALALYAGDIGLEALISLASDESNLKHLDFQVKHFIEGIKKQDLDEQIVFDTVTYKPESTLLVESQQLAYAVKLAQSGFDVKIIERDSVISELKEIYGDLFKYQRR
tara:strand:- start:955 stop:2064 length:1110 start_codon:yes stop_codon:yes gene_type:complete